MIPSSLCGSSNPCLVGSRSSTWRRSSTSDVDICPVLSRPPVAIALTGRSRRRLETLAESRISLSPRSWTERTLPAKSCECTSRARRESTKPETVASMVETVCGSSLTIWSADDTSTVVAASGGLSTRSASGACTMAVCVGALLLISLASDLLFYGRDHVLQDFVGGRVDNVAERVGQVDPVRAGELLELCGVAGAEGVLDLQTLQLAVALEQLTHLVAVLVQGHQRVLGEQPG